MKTDTKNRQKYQNNTKISKLTNEYENRQIDIGTDKWILWQTNKYENRKKDKQIRLVWFLDALTSPKPVSLTDCRFQIAKKAQNPSVKMR